MSALDEALDGLDGAGTVDVAGPHGPVQVDVVEADKLGVRVRGLTVSHEPRSPERSAAVLPERLAVLPGRLESSEVDAALGGAVLRTRVSDLRKGRFFEVRAGERTTEVRRYRIEDGERLSEDFTLTREQLHDVVDGVQTELQDEDAAD